MDTIDFFVFDEVTPALARDLAERLRARPSAPVTVRVNSYGGDLAAGLAMLNALRAHRGAVRVEIEGIAASAATLLCCAGTVAMAGNAALMVHAPWVSITGNARDLRDGAQGLETMAEGMAGAYRQKTGKPAAEIDRLLDGRDHWFTAAEALAFGLIDEILPARRIAARLGTLKLPGRFAMTTDTQDPTRTLHAADAARIEDAAAKAALAREQERRREISGRLTGSLAKRPELQQILAACLDDIHCTPEMASQRFLAKMGESAEPLHGSMCVPGEGHFALHGDMARAFRASERAGRIGNPIGFGGHGSGHFIAAASDALALRMGAQLKKVAAGADDFRESGITGLAAICAQAAGQPMLGKSRANIIHAAMTTSDFPELLSTAANKALVNRFEVLIMEHRQLCDVGDLVDFKPAKVVNTSFLPGLLRKLEGGEIKFGAITEGAETYALATYARGLLLTREAMINDDLGAFDGLIRAAANSAARLERDLIFGVLTANAALSDGVALFHANHGNLDTSGKTPDVAGLSAARVLMRKQQDASGGFVMTAPRFIVCPVAIESAAEALVAALTYSQSGGSEIETPQWIRGLVPISDPRLDAADAADWYLLSDPRTAPVIRLGYLNGVQTPAVEQDVDFDRDILKFKIRFDVACAAVGYAGAVKMA